MTKKTVVFDFDGVIHSYISGWCGDTVIPDPPTEGVPKLIKRLRSAGYEVVVVSARCGTLPGLVAVTSWLEDNGIEVDNVTAIKPPAIVYIDDRAVRFTGPLKTTFDIDMLYREITTFKPWNK